MEKKVEDFIKKAFPKNSKFETKWDTMAKGTNGSLLVILSTIMLDDSADIFRYGALTHLRLDQLEEVSNLCLHVNVTEQEKNIEIHLKIK